MKKLIRAIKWDLQLQFRYHIMTVAAVVTILYAGSFLIIPMEDLDTLLISLVFSDPAMLGFMFIGVLVLFEKGADTLSALTITPLEAKHYLWAKAISLTMIAIPCSMVMAIVAHGWDFNWMYFLLGVISASFLFVFVGFIGVARVKSLNQYMVIIPLYLTPFLLPAFNFFGLTDTWLWYLIPSQGPLLLLEGAFRPISNLDLLYALSYPILGIWGLYHWARLAWKNYILCH